MIDGSEIITNDKMILRVLYFAISPTTLAIASITNPNLETCNLGPIIQFRAQGQARGPCVVRRAADKSPQCSLDLPAWFLRLQFAFEVQLDGNYGAKKGHPSFSRGLA
jgi:hypothetical protein